MDVTDQDLRVEPRRKPFPDFNRTSNNVRQAIAERPAQARVQVASVSRGNGRVSSSPVITVEKLNVRYSGFRAVKNLSFQVEQGEIYALLGTNGAGKTSTLEVIEGHRRASSGTVRVFGKDPADRGAVRSRVGIMLQESGFAADLTVSEKIGRAHV